MPGNVVTLADLDPADRDLVRRALTASAQAYAPYSGFAVGAAIRMRDSKTVFTGANFENAAYGVTMCAEVSVLAQLHLAGDFNVDAMAIIGHKFTEPPVSSEVVTPCGRCRQLIAEVTQHGNPQLRIFCCSGDLEKISVWTIATLLPAAFGPQNLGVVDTWSKLREELRARTRRLSAHRQK
jgi:cytidine deaminase